MRWSAPLSTCDHVILTVKDGLSIICMTIEKHQLKLGFRVSVRHSFDIPFWPAEFAAAASCRAASVMAETAAEALLLESCGNATTPCQNSTSLCMQPNPYFNQVIGMHPSIGHKCLPQFEVSMTRHAPRLPLPSQHRERGVQPAARSSVTSAGCPSQWCHPPIPRMPRCHRCQTGPLQRHQTIHEPLSRWHFTKSCEYHTRIFRLFKLAYLQ